MIGSSIEFLSPDDVHYQCAAHRNTSGRPHFERLCRSSGGNMPALSANSFTADDGKKIFYRAAEPDPARAALIVLHGLGEHSGRYTHVIEHFAARGLAVFAPDHRGHGMTAEIPGYVKDMNRVVTDVSRLLDHVNRAHPGLPVFLLGHSLGGLLAMLALLRFQERFAGAVLSAPGVAVPDNVSPLVVKIAGILSAVAPTLPVQHFEFDEVCRDPDVVEATKHDPLFYRGRIRARTGYGIITGITAAREGADRISLPLLVLHGSEDRSVPVEASRFVHERAASPDKALVIFPGLYHEILNEPEREEVFATIDRWLDERAAAHARGRTAGGTADSPNR